MFDPNNSLKGASQRMCDDYRAVLETGSTEGTKYPTVPVMQDLADVIMGRGGIKKDSPLLELCNLVFAINQTLDGRPPRHRLLSFFTEISQYTAKAPIYRQWFLDNQTRITNHFLITELGINVTYPDGQFFIYFSRMPLLNALFEFLLQMDAFSFSEEFLEKLEEIQSESASDETLTFRAVQDVSNKLSSRLHSYRKMHLNKIFLGGKFERARETFLKDRKLSVTDDGILEFWIEHVGISGFREYQPVFRHVMEFVTAFKEAELEQEFKNPLSIDEKSPEGFSIEIAAGIDADESQDNLPNQAIAQTTSAKYRVSATLEDWVSPLSILAEEPASRIKFLKNNSELKPLENIMTYGPLANEFPISMLRLDTFGKHNQVNAASMDRKICQQR